MGYHNADIPLCRRLYDPSADYLPGGLFSERSGVVNIGLEGLMVVGSFTSALTISSLYPVMGSAAVWMGLGAAVLAGAAFFTAPRLCQHQPQRKPGNQRDGHQYDRRRSYGFLCPQYHRFGKHPDRFRTLPPQHTPFERPADCRPLFFTQTYTTTWLVLLILFGAWFLIYKTSFGLRLRSCGEHPQAADAAGVNVYLIRYIGVLFSGAFAGLGGAIILVTYSGEFNGSVAGLGFLALASLIFGQWKPWGFSPRHSSSGLPRPSPMSPR